MADSVQAGVESADLAYTVPEYAPEPEPPSHPQRNRSLTDLYQVQVAMNSIIKVYNLSLGEAINTRGADVAKDAALTELSQIFEKGCLMPMDRLIVKKLKANTQRILPSKLFLKVKYPLAGTFDKFNARLAGGGHRQNHDVFESTSSPTVATSSVPMVVARSANRGNARMTTNVLSAYPYGHMRIDMPMVYK
jgi:hypothetical protein